MEQKVVSTAVRPRQIEFSSRVSWKSEHLSQNFIHICQRYFRWLNVVGCTYNVLKGFCCTLTLWETVGWVVCLPTSFNPYCIDSVCLYVESFFSPPRLFTIITSCCVASILGQNTFLCDCVRSNSYMCLNYLNDNVTKCKKVKWKKRTFN